MTYLVMEYIMLYETTVFTIYMTRGYNTTKTAKSWHFHNQHYHPPTNHNHNTVVGNCNPSHGWQTVDLPTLVSCLPKAIYTNNLVWPGSITTLWLAPFQSLIMTRNSSPQLDLWLDLQCKFGRITRWIIAPLNSFSWSPYAVSCN